MRETGVMKLYLRTSVIVLAAIAAASCASESGLTQGNTPPPTFDATVKLSGGVLAAGVGYKWGHGTLNYQGQEFKFCIRGLSVGDVGVAKLAAQGLVFNLKSLDDFSGRYVALSGGFTVGRGESAAILKNKHGVMMELESQEVGVRFSIAATGLRIAMAGGPGCKVPKSTSN
jgi:hypothetical protein